MDLVKYTDRALVFQRNAQNLEELQSVIHSLAYFTSNLPWLFGDLCIYAETRFGEMWAQIIPENIIRSNKTMLSWAFICRRIPQERRRWDLSFSHYKEVAKLPDVEQEIMLEGAEAEGWSVSELRRRIKGETEKKPKTIKCPQCGAEWEE